MKHAFLLVAALLDAGLLLNRPDSAKVHPAQVASLLSPGTFDSAGRVPVEAERCYQVVNAGNGLEGLSDGKTEERVNTGYDKLVGNDDARYPPRDGAQRTINRSRLYDYNDQHLDKPFTLSSITADWQTIPKLSGDDQPEPRR